MSDQHSLSSDELSRQNELICEKLLGWQRSARGAIVAWSGWHNGTPTFTTWAEAGLILEAMISNGPTLEYSEGKWDCYGGDPFESFFHAHADTGPLAIRAAAIEYIKAVKS